MLSCPPALCCPALLPQELMFSVALIPSANSNPADVVRQGSRQPHCFDLCNHVTCALTLALLVSDDGIASSDDDLALSETYGVE